MDWWQSDPPLTMTVFESSAEPIDTGLLNADGTKIYRQTKMAPIGFDLSDRTVDDGRQT